METIQEKTNEVIEQDKLNKAEIEEIKSRKKGNWRRNQPGCITRLNYFILATWL